MAMATLALVLAGVSIRCMILYCQREDLAKENSRLLLLLEMHADSVRKSDRLSSASDS